MSYSIKFQNFSSTQWTRSVNGSTIDAVLQNLNKVPGDYLKAHSGLEEIAADQSALSFVATGNIDLYCCWFNPKTSQRFGIQLLVPVQVFGIGSAPYWYVMTDNASINDNPNWISSGSDPAYQYNFQLSGFNINANPTAGHASLDIAVTIQDAK